MWTKIKEFFKKFWYVVLVPVGLFIIHLFVGSKKDAKLKGQEKEQKKDIKEDKKKVKDATKKVEKSEKEVEKESEKVEKKTEELSKATEECKETIAKDKKDKKVRDEKASKYLPNM